VRPKQAGSLIFREAELFGAYEKGGKESLAALNQEQQGADKKY